MKTQQQLLREIRDKILELRSLERIVASSDFAQLINNELIDLVEKSDAIKVRKYIKERLEKEKDLEEIPLKRLREIARDLGIENWSIWSKATLIIKIKGNNVKSNFENGVRRNYQGNQI